ncbi:hypothetical protein BJ165DRAFT_1522689 [Panaeolus papilionaceus]|nr:hypothetical protein BJ165DRAFT_1522689 [Panaeolus papilionaceus]
MASTPPPPPPGAGPGTIVMPLTAAFALTGTFYALAFLTTFIRLYHRVQIRKFWWDDFWAAFGLISGILTCVLWLGVQKIMNPKQSFATRYFGVTGMFVAYTHSLWCTKLSVAVTIVRLLGDGKLRIVSKFVAFLFGVAGVTLIFQKAFICGFHFRTIPICHIPVWTGYLELSFDLTGDVWLIFAPLYVLHNTHLAGVHRRLLIAIFSCGIFVTAASIARAYFIFTGQNLMMGVIGHLQVAISLITCNLLVLVTYIYRKVNRNSHGSIERSTAPTESSNVNGRITQGGTMPDPSQIQDTQNSHSHITLTTLGSSMLDPLASSEARPASTTTSPQTSQPAKRSFRFPFRRTAQKLGS